MYLWWSLCILSLHACQVRVTVGDSGLCWWTCVIYSDANFNSLVWWNAQEHDPQNIHRMEHIPVWRAEWSPACARVRARAASIWSCWAWSCWPPCSPHPLRKLPWRRPREAFWRGTRTACPKVSVPMFWIWCSSCPPCPSLGCNWNSVNHTLRFRGQTWCASLAVRILQRHSGTSKCHSHYQPQCHRETSKCHSHYQPVS